MRTVKRNRVPIRVEGPAQHAVPLPSRSPRETTEGAGVPNSRTGEYEQLRHDLELFFRRLSKEVLHTE